MTNTATKLMIDKKTIIEYNINKEHNNNNNNNNIRKNKITKTQHRDIHGE